MGQIEFNFEFDLHNLDHLVRVKFNPFYHCSDIYYHPERTTFWGKKKAEYFYGICHWNEDRTREQILESGKYTIHNNKVYTKPNVVFIFSDGSYKTYRFDSEREALKVMKYYEDKLTNLSTEINDITNKQ